MASGFAITWAGTRQGGPRGGFASRLLRPVALALIAGALLTSAASAQERADGGPAAMAQSGPGGNSGAAPLSHMDPGAPSPVPLDEPVGVTVLDSPAPAAAEDTFAAPAEVPVTDVSAADQAAAPPDIGLIEAPEGALGIAPDSLPGLGIDPFADSPAVATFAERRTAQSRARQFGPIGHPPVVVELFTSQGCSSCPPADKMLADLADRDDILALSWHVDYWDYLGWADEFARPEFTRRQQAYAHAWRERAIYTPQMIVGGTDTLIALRPAELMTLVDMQMARPAPVLVNASAQPDGGYRIELTPRAAIQRPVALLLVRYAPQRSMMIKAGENRGVTVNYRNVVLAVERVGEWDGRTPLRMNVQAGVESGDAFPEDTRHVILAQELGRGKGATGPILAAIRLD